MDDSSMNGNNDTSIEPGTILGGRYRIDELIGQGGMGAVYASTHVELGRKVAVKTLHPQFVSDENASQRFRQEAQMAASIGHDNICEVIDVGTADDGSGYLVMPLLSGSSLAELLQEERIPVQRLVDIICQTLSALQAAHDAHIVHRDLKPDNIFVTKFGDRNDFVKLLDFGISKIMDQESVSKLTRTGMVVGTPCYMSPEQAKGARDLDYRVDIYAIGVILYEALTGRCPFEGETYNEIIFKIVAEPFPTPASLNPVIPKNLENIVLKAMSRDVSSRYESASSMRDELKAVWLDDRNGVGSPLATNATALADASPFTPTGLKVVGMAGGLQSTAAPADSLRASVEPATPSAWTVDKQNDISPPTNKNRALVGILIGVAVVLLGFLAYLVTKDKNTALPVAVPIAEPVDPLPSPATEPPQEMSKELGPNLTLPEDKKPETDPAKKEKDKEKAEKEAEEKKRANRKARRKSRPQTVAEEKPAPTIAPKEEPARKIVIIETLPDDPEPPPKKPAAKPKTKKSGELIDGKYGSKYVSDY
jgi:serine/threonine-protein kinase